MENPRHDQRAERNPVARGLLRQRCRYGGRTSGVMGGAYWREFAKEDGVTLGKASRWAIVFAVLGALAVGAPDAIAKHGNRGGGSRHKQHRVYKRSGSDYRYSTRSYVVRDPRVVTRYETRVVRRPYIVERHRYYRPYVVRDYRSYAVRDYRFGCGPQPVRVIRYGDRPFYFNAGLNFYFDNADLSLTFGQIPPVGYVYHDPICDVNFTYASAYQDHLYYHHHDPLVEVVPACQPY